MKLLTDLSCEVCRKGAPLATSEEITGYMAQLQGWQIIEIDGISRLTKTYHVKNFKQALLLTNCIGAIAEQEGHHPALLTEWGRVTVSWWTHKIGGLHTNDFIMAAKTDDISV